ncbi:hypothetical protein GY45DRAFT_1314740 [Cubamyces sp. BRFM 1775]|nr:hypothetical protein GY45DRAFT_1314740 [Cubamyces sp. BRFM 1775]
MIYCVLVWLRRREHDSQQVSRYVSPPPTAVTGQPSSERRSRRTKNSSRRTAPIPKQSCSRYRSSPIRTACAFSTSRNAQRVRAGSTFPQCTSCATTTIPKGVCRRTRRSALTARASMGSSGRSGETASIWRTSARGGYAHYTGQLPRLRSGLYHL